MAHVLASVAAYKLDIRPWAEAAIRGMAQARRAVAEIARVVKVTRPMGCAMLERAL